MEARNCRRCGRIFNYMEGAPFCPNCIKEIENKFQEVKQYIYENPNVNINVVAEENQVSIKQIKQWVREERLSFSEDSPVGIECEVCGTNIKTGRYCNNCRKTMEKRLSNAIKRPEITGVAQRKKSTESKMRFLDKH